MPRFLASWFAAALAGALLLGACGGGSDNASDSKPSASPTTFQPSTEPVGPFTVLVGSSLESGVPLIDGLVVAEGSNILGSTFPDGDGEGGFLALGLVTGDPVVVFNDYIGQADLLGMTVSDQGGCLPSATAVACLRNLADPADGESLSVRVERRPAGVDGIVSHVALRYRPPGSTDPAEVGTEGAAPPTSPLTPPPLPSSVAEPPNDQWNSAVAPFGPFMTMAADTYLVGPPGPCGCADSGWSAVFRIVGEPEEAIAAYAAQVTATPPETVSQVVDGREVVAADLGLVAGGFMQLRSVEDGGAAWLMIAVAQP